MSYLYDAVSACTANLHFHNTKVSVPSPNQPGVFETATNDSEQVSQQEMSDDNTRVTLLLDLPVSNDLYWHELLCTPPFLDNGQQSSSE